jgi:Zn-dependent M28 family amino/carboxypeptidase
MTSGAQVEEYKEQHIPCQVDCTSNGIGSSRQQTADSRQQTANSKQQTADSKQQTANSKQQTANSRQ